VVNPRAVGAILGALALLVAYCVACSLQTKGPILWEGASDGGLADSSLSDSSVQVVLINGPATVQVGMDGGNPYTDTCPMGQVVIGYRGDVLSPDSGLIVVVSRIQTLCGAIVVDETAADPVSITPGFELPVRGTHPGPSWSETCAANDVIVGFSGHSGQFVDQLAFQCGHWIVSNEDAGPMLTMSSAYSLPAVGGDGGSPFPLEACPAGQMAIGTALRSGFWLDAFSLQCGTPSLDADAGL
jgi:hypothetical protein